MALTDLCSLSHGLISNDGWEVRLGSDPLAPGSVPAATLQIYPAVNLQFEMLESVRYQLEVSSDLAGWSSEGSTIVGTGTAQNYWGRSSNSQRYWLRVFP